MDSNSVSKLRYALLFILVIAIVSSKLLAAGPEPTLPIPSVNQVRWHKREIAAFIHFNINTFTGNEWGTGREDPKVFNPTQLDCNQWVDVVKAAGCKMIILTAKHHDGFCIWPSEYTTHDVESSTWRNGKGDVVKECAEACKKGNIDYGLYSSPWDRHEPTYGSSNYNTYMANQLTELYTNYGPLMECWFDGAGSMGASYDWDTWENIVRTLNPDAVIFSCLHGGHKADIHWIGNENGRAGEPNWSMCDEQTVINETTSILIHGELDGKKWIPGESDVSIRPGWYYHANQDNQVKSLDHLIRIYYETVGRNSVLLLNFPPDRRGLMHKNDSMRAVEFGNFLKGTFQNDLTYGASASASDTWGDEFEANNVIDGDTSTFWTPPEGVTNASLEIDLDTVKKFDIIMLQEYIQLGQRVTSYKIEAWYDDKWNNLFTKKSIGNKRLLVLRSPIKASKIRLKVLDARGCPCIHTLGLFLETREYVVDIETNRSIPKIRGLAIKGISNNLFTFDVPVNRKYTIELINTKGVMVKSICSNREFKSGMTKVRWNSSLLPNGFYCIRILSKNFKILTKGFILMK